jgi:pilus assembly protein Flp/PilA
MLKYTVAFANFVHARYRGDDRGATAVEYGLIVALIAAVIIVVVTTLGTNIRTAFCRIVTGTGGGACQ